MDELYTLLILSGWTLKRHKHGDVPAFILINPSNDAFMCRHTVHLDVRKHPMENLKNITWYYADAKWEDAPRPFLEECLNIIDDDNERNMSSVVDTI